MDYLTVSLCGETMEFILAILLTQLCGFAISTNMTLVEQIFAEYGLPEIYQEPESNQGKNSEYLEQADSPPEMEQDVALDLSKRTMESQSGLPKVSEKSNNTSPIDFSEESNNNAPLDLSRQRVVSETSPSKAVVVPESLPSEAVVVPESLPSEAIVVPESLPSKTAVVPESLPSETLALNSPNEQQHQALPSQQLPQQQWWSPQYLPQQHLGASEFYNSGHRCASGCPECMTTAHMTINNPHMLCWTRKQIDQCMAWMNYALYGPQQSYSTTYQWDSESPSLQQHSDGSLGLPGSSGRESDFSPFRNIEPIKPNESTAQNENDSDSHSEHSLMIDIEACNDDDCQNSEMREQAVQTIATEDSELITSTEVPNVPTTMNSENSDTDDKISDEALSPEFPELYCHEVLDNEENHSTGVPKTQNLVRPSLKMKIKVVPKESKRRRTRMSYLLDGNSEEVSTETTLRQTTGS